VSPITGFVRHSAEVVPQLERECVARVAALEEELHAAIRDRDWIRKVAAAMGIDVVANAVAEATEERNLRHESERRHVG
jgi:hypothetical protein